MNPTIRTPFMSTTTTTTTTSSTGSAAHNPNKKSLFHSVIRHNYNNNGGVVDDSDSLRENTTTTHHRSHLKWKRSNHHKLRYTTNTNSGNHNKSKSDWKRVLKQKCLERARQKRQTVHSNNRRLRQRHHQENQEGQQEQESSSATTRIGNATTISISNPRSRNMLQSTAREVIEEQLSESRICVEMTSGCSSLTMTAVAAAVSPSPVSSPCSKEEQSYAYGTLGTASSHTHNKNGPRMIFPMSTRNNFQDSGKQHQSISTKHRLSQDQMTTMQDDDYKNDNGDYYNNCIQEEELYQLMQEVEEELNREEEEFVEEELISMEMEQGREDEYLQAQIEEYEQWYEESGSSSNMSL